jgi:hypothetical protein
MRSSTVAVAAGSLVLAVLLVSGVHVGHAQDGGVAQIGIGNPLPVHVTNEPVLPEGFGAGSNWRFTTWTSPSVITWTGRVQRISGPWALITVSQDNATTTRWYYVPAMPGSWEKQ